MASYIAFAVILPSAVVCAPRVKVTEANKIYLRAKLRNITFAMQKYHSVVRRNTTNSDVFFSKSPLAGEMILILMSKPIGETAQPRRISKMIYCDKFPEAVLRRAECFRTPTSIHVERLRKVFQQHLPAYIFLRI